MKIEAGYEWLAGVYERPAGTEALDVYVGKHQDSYVIRVLDPNTNECWHHPELFADWESAGAEAVRVSEHVNNNFNYLPLEWSDNEQIQSLRSKYSRR